MQRIIARNKKYFMFILVIVLLGFLVGIFYYHFLNNDMQNKIINTVNSISYLSNNNILKDLIVMSSLLILSFLIIGLPLSIFYIFYESLSIGFMINTFFISFKVKGLIYILLYILINKLIPFILIIIFIRKIINISRLVIGYFIYKKDAVIKEKLIINFQNSLYIIVFVFIINIILYFISPIIFKGMSFLLK